MVVTIKLQNYILLPVRIGRAYVSGMSLRTSTGASGAVTITRRLILLSLIRFIFFATLSTSYKFEAQNTKIFYRYRHKFLGTFSGTNLNDHIQSYP